MEIPPDPLVGLRLVPSPRLLFLVSTGSRIVPGSRSLRSGNGGTHLKFPKRPQRLNWISGNDWKMPMCDKKLEFTWNSRLKLYQVNFKSAFWTVSEWKMWHHLAILGLKRPPPCCLGPVKRSLNYSGLIPENEFQANTSTNPNKVAIWHDKIYLKCVFINGLK